MRQKRKKPAPREAVHLDAKPDCEKVKAGDVQRPPKQDERAQDPRVEPIERR
ncbi:MAG: hypothetical protein H8E53_11780 [Planctomycetes bacterium]|nr:hypothetical protein [Planctomycetota bacterium]